MTDRAPLQAFRDLSRMLLEVQTLPWQRARATGLALTLLARTCGIKRRGLAWLPFVGDYFFRKQIKRALAAQDNR